MSLRHLALAAIYAAAFTAPAFAETTVTMLHVSEDKTTQAIQAAINTASVNGDTVYIPAGTYGISETLTITNTMGVRLVGDGVLATRLQPSGAMSGVPVVRFVDAMPLAYLVGGVAAFLSRRGQRLGDLAAGTLVIWEPPQAMPDLASVPGGKYNSLRTNIPVVARLR